MKKAFSILLLLILFLPGIYKSGIVIYYELNKEYIATNLCVNKDRPMTMCYGKCFLNKGLEIGDQKSNTPGLAQVKLEISDYTMDDFTFDAFASILSTKFLSTIIPQLADGITSVVFHPPLV